MAKKIRESKQQHDTGKLISTPSWFGSHKSMVVDTPEALQLEDWQCVCKDDQGLYVTAKHNLDNGLCDFNRLSQKMRIK